VFSCFFSGYSIPKWQKNKTIGIGSIRQKLKTESSDMKFMDTPDSISYDDICLVPQYSDLRSRKDADISIYQFRNPIINSPMIHTSSKRMIKYMVNNGMMTTAHRYFKNAQEQLDFVRSAFPTRSKNDHEMVFYSVGMKHEWWCIK